MIYIYCYVVLSYVLWYAILIRNEKTSTVGKMFFWFAPLLIPVVLIEIFILRKL